MANIYFNNSLSEMLQSTPKFFKEELFSKTYVLDPSLYDIGNVIDFISDVSIEDFILKNEEVAVSTEGKHMSGKRLIVTVKLKGKLSYSTNNVNYNVKVLFFDFIKNISVVIPEVFKGEYTEDLIRAKRFTINPYIEDLYCRKIDARSIHILAMLFLDIKFC